MFATRLFGKEYRIKISRMSPNKIVMFLINPPSGNAKRQKLIAKHVLECFEKKKEKTAKSKYSRTKLINNLIHIWLVLLLVTNMCIC